MHRSVFFIAVGLTGLCFLEKARGAETGDIDGDGLVTLADVVSYLEGLPPAPGSLDGLESDPCLSFQPANLPGAISLEVVRRSVPPPGAAPRGEWRCAPPAVPGGFLARNRPPPLASPRVVHRLDRDPAREGELDARGH